MRSILLRLSATTGLVLAGLTPFLAGCGGGGGSAGSGAPTPGRTSSLVTFNVDVATGKVKIASTQDTRSRAVLTGGAVTFGSSDLLSVGGDSGKRLLRVSVTNNTQEGGLSNARLLIGNLSNTAALNFKTSTTVSTYAGNGTAGNVNGIGTAAQFNNPGGVTAGSGINGTNMFVSDRGSHVIRSIFGDGSVTNFAGSAGNSGFVNGVGTTARFNAPSQIAADSNGNIFVADTGNNAIRRITSQGDVTTVAGTGVVGSQDGDGNTATFSGPRGIAVNSDGSDIWVADTDNNRIRLITYNSGPRNASSSYSVTTISGSTAGYTDGDSASAQFREPYALTLAQGTLFSNSLFVADRLNNAIRRIDNAFGSFGKVSTVAGAATAGNTDGVGTDARFDRPVGISAVSLGSTTDPVTAFFVTESNTNHRLRGVFYKPGNDPGQSGNYVVATLAGAAASFADGDGNAARFSDPLGVFAVQGSSSVATLYIADRANNRLRKVLLNTGTLLGSGGPLNSVAEPVRLVNWDNEEPEPGRTTWSKNIGGTSGVFNTTSTELQFYIPQGVSGFTFTALVEADTELTNLPAVGASYISTLAGDGNAGNSNGLPKLAEFATPIGVASISPSSSGRYGVPVSAFVSEYGNHTIRYVSATGYVGSFVGSTKGYADGTGASALFDTPYGIAVALDGSLVVADSGNRRIRVVSPNGVVTTIAGTGAVGAADGTGNVATFTSPRGVTVDTGGAIYVADFGAHVIRKIVYVSGNPGSAASYQVTTVAGTAGVSGSTDGVGTAARFKSPGGIAADSDSRIYVADSGNNTIRALTRVAGGAMQVTTLAGSAGLSGTTDGTGAAARFNLPLGITVDRAHNLYVADYVNNRIRRINPLGAVVTLAGSVAGFVDGPAGRFNQPAYLDVEEGGSLVITDSANHSVRVLHRVLSEAPNTGQ